MRRLAKARGAVRSTLVASLSRLWDETLCWFGPEDDPTMQRLYHEGIIDATPDELGRRYLHTIMPTLSSLEIEVPVCFNTETKCWELRQSLPWQTWDPEARRVTPT
jgi:1,2-phenylacetyl-CoA epoxidase catalytic subunit